MTVEWHSCIVNIALFIYFIFLTDRQQSVVPTVAF